MIRDGVASATSCSAILILSFALKQPLFMVAVCLTKKQLKTPDIPASLKVGATGFSSAQ